MAISEDRNPVRLVSFNVHRAVSTLMSPGLKTASTRSDKRATRTQLTDRAFKWRVHLNVLALSLGLLLVFTGVTPLATIQSSMNAEKGLGTTSLSVHTASMVLEALLLNTLLMSRLGIKWSLLLGVLLETLYVGANLYPRWWTLIPAAFVSGLGRPLMRSAEATYLSAAASVYARRLAQKEDEVKSRFFSFFYVFYCSSRVVGNVMCSLILGSGIEKFSVSYIKKFMADTAASNATLHHRQCGAEFCSASSSLLAAAQSSANRTVPLPAVPTSHVDAVVLYQLCGFAFGCLLAGAAIILFFLRQPQRLDDVDEGGKAEADDSSPEAIKRPLQYMLSTVRNWKNPKQLMLIPISVYNGMDNAFWQADFTKAFVTCTVGIHWVGFIVAWYGLTAPLVVLLFTCINKSYLRPVPFTCAFVAHLGTAVTLLYWTPSVAELPVLFGVSAVWGIGSGLWPYCVTAFYSVVFADNLAAGFSNYWLFDSLGGTLSYAWSHSLCTWTKTVVLAGILSAGFCGYVLVEIALALERRKKSRKETRDAQIESSSKLAAE